MFAHFLVTLGCMSSRPNAYVHIYSTHHLHFANTYFEVFPLFLLNKFIFLVWLGKQELKNDNNYSAKFRVIII